MHEDQSDDTAVLALKFGNDIAQFLVSPYFPLRFVRKMVGKVAANKKDSVQS